MFGYLKARVVIQDVGNYSWPISWGASNSCFFLYSVLFIFVFFQAEDGIRDLVRSRGLGDVYKRQEQAFKDQQKIDSFVELVNKSYNEKQRQLIFAMAWRLSLIHI